MEKTLEILEAIGKRWQALVSIVCLAMFFVGLIGLVNLAVAESKKGTLPVLTTVKLEEKQYFHQLELIFEGRPRFSMQKYKGMFYLKLRNIDNDSLPTAVGSTSLLSQLPTKVMKDKLGTLTSIVVDVDGDFRTEMSAYEKPGAPFRIVIEFYSIEGAEVAVSPASDKGAASVNKKKVLKGNKKTAKARDFWEQEQESSGKVKKTRKKKVVKAVKKTIVKKSRTAKVKKVEKIERVTSREKSVGVAAFNDGWRWKYRKKVVSAIRDTETGIYREALRALGEKLGLEDAAEPVQLIAELTTLVADYETGEENGKAEVLKGIIPFFQGNGDVEVMDALLRKYAYTGFTRLGRFVEGAYYEQKGFIPEALAHYNMTVVGREDEDIPEPFTNVIIAEANFRMGMAYFMEYKMEEASNHFKRASLQGSRSARKWLANTLLVKGLTKDARRIYSEVEPDDPVTMMSLADISVLNGDYDTARDYYDALSEEFSGDALVSAYFMIRIADTYQIEGRIDDANRRYNIARDNLGGDGRAMASLALAEILIDSDDHEAYRDALRYYGTVAEGNYIGTEEAYLMSARLHMQLGNNSTAIALLGKMGRLFPLGELRLDADRARGEITLKWLDKLAYIGDDEGFVKVFLTYEPYIPFGKKSGAYIQAGRAFLKLGFTTDAVKVLNSLVKMGESEHLEEAMIMLVKGYLAQEDIESADRLMMFFKATFPKTKFKKRYAKLQTEINYRKGQYKKVVETREVKRRADWNNSEDMMVVASSFFRLNNYKKAEERYRRAAELLAEAQQNKKLADACMGVAESSFMQGKYKESIKFYRCAAELSKTKDKDGSSIDVSWATYRLAESNFRIGKSFEGTEALESLKQTDRKMAEWGKYLFAENGK
ncbi:hypothetical protein MNBD_DELTA01-1711 [hydrothermal vent metagenome]|uniref:Tetratricopeptide repeat protein n=1 Tax=hydrothermal vent metagenome TaxID=652676 RepID=A0A3B0QUV9_9ZZZZ